MTGQGFVRRAGVVGSALAFAAASLLVAAPAATASPVTPVQISATAVVPAAVPAYTAKENRYWRALLSEDPTWASVGKRDTIKAGKLICKLLRGGMSGEEMIDFLYYEVDMAEEDVVNIVAASVVFLCPSQSYKFD